MALRVLACLGCAAAVFRDDAGDIDGKSVALGRVLAASQNNGTIAVTGDAGVLSLLNEWGASVWRQPLEPHQLASAVAHLGDVVVVGGRHLSGYNATDGTLLWTRAHASTDVRAAEAEGEGGAAAYIAEGLIVSPRGEIERSAAPAPALAGVAAARVAKEGAAGAGEIRLLNGTLKWDSLDVLTYVHANGTLGFTRDSGLAHARSGLFVRHRAAEAEAAAELQEEFGDDDADAGPASGGLGALQPFAKRVAKHLRELYELFFIILRKGPSLVVLPEQPKDSFGFEQTLVVVTAHGSVYGLNATSRDVAWVYHDLDAVRAVPHEEDAAQFYVESAEGSVFLMNADGEFVGTVAERGAAGGLRPFEQVEQSGATLRSPRGWTLELPGDAIVGAAARDPRDATASVTVPVDGAGSILYKYLNPFAAAYASYAREQRRLVVTLVDTVTGRVLGQFAHAEPVLVNEEWPFRIAFGEHWVVYTYLSLDASQAPKLAVLELYESATPNERRTPAAVNVLSDTLAPHVAARSWVLPSRGGPVWGLGLSASRFGASAREIVLAFEHQVVAVPKLLASTLAPPATVLAVPESGHLSHIIGVSRAHTVVTGATNLESTYLVAALGGPDILLTRSMPSGEFDRLNKVFPKVKLLVFVSVLGFAVATLSPLARLKLLQQQWR